MKLLFVFLLPALFAVSQTTSQCSGKGSYYDGCNWCSCTSNGLAICTLRACEKNVKRNVDDAPGNACEGSLRWTEGCAECSCVDGKSECDRTACVPEPEEEPTCQAGDSWTVDCNTCLCSGGKPTCTRKACKKPAITDSTGPEDEIETAPILDALGRQEEVECSESDVWHKNCNTCRCVNGKAACTKKKCTPILDALGRQEEVECSEGDVWEEDCNTCHCSDGKAACTKKRCRVTRQTRPFCKPGDVWKQDCNTCRCINGRAACTKKGCFNKSPFRGGK